MAGRGGPAMASKPPTELPCRLACCSCASRLSASLRSEERALCVGGTHG